MTQPSFFIKLFAHHSLFVPIRRSLSTSTPSKHLCLLGRYRVLMQRLRCGLGRGLAFCWCEKDESSARPGCGAAGSEDSDTVSGASAPDASAAERANGHGTKQGKARCVVSAYSNNRVSKFSASTNLLSCPTGIKKLLEVHQGSTIPGNHYSSSERRLCTCTWPLMSSNLHDLLSSAFLLAL